MGNIKVSSDSSLKRLNNFIKKFIDIEYLEAKDSSQIDIVRAVNILIEDYRARYDD